MTLVSACASNCKADTEVTIVGLVMAVKIAVDKEPVEPVQSCAAADSDHDEKVSMDEIRDAVENALKGCGSGASRETAASPGPYQMRP